jgi:hypothetical protein
MPRDVQTLQRVTERNEGALRRVTERNEGALRRVTERNEGALRRVTEQIQKQNENMNPTRSQKTDLGSLGSLELKGPIQEFKEERFWEHLSRAYEHYVGKPWTPADKLKAQETLRQSWAVIEPNWIIRYYAFLSGLCHMAAARDVKNRWAYACSMVHKYAEISADFVTRNARLRARGQPLRQWEFRRLEMIEDCIGPDYALRGEAEVA